MAPQWIPRHELVYRCRTPWMKGRPGPLEEGPWYNCQNLCCKTFSQRSWKGHNSLQPGDCALGKRKSLHLLGVNGHWLWSDIRSRKPTTSLWSTSQNRGSWRSDDQWSFSLRLSHSGPSGSPHLSHGYFPEWIIGADVLSNYQIPCIGFLWRKGYCRKCQMEATGTTSLKKIVNQKQYHILEGSAEISATVKDLKDERVVIPTILYS